MKLTLYVRRDSPVHALSAGWKLGLLLATGLLILLTDDIRLLGIGFTLTLTGFLLARLPLANILHQARPLLIVLAIFFAAHALFTTVELGAVLTLRFAIMIACGLLLTLTTRVSDLMAVLERALQPFAPLGLDPEKASLVFAMTIRFIPALAETWETVRAAQQARGMDRNPLALLIPMTVLTLRRAEQISDAIEARGIDL
ncbi:energy-coupling factor transporter transmembrane component T family protein [Nisaea nitritireducens]|uniref:energy-coupling factor transporter transmembrane component T family protein n=1 Tax=Nisaea nitritireducens TaxID=568392 RepID=UPI0018683965|nr:energy-coupling factor transporter transmembrane protein EcfT [Nisaea nitritireducens]